MVDFTVLEPIGAAVIFSLIWFARSKDTDTLNPDDWNWYKFLATFSVGLFVTFALYQSGADPTMANFASRMAMYAGYVVLIQGAIQSAVRNLRPHMMAFLYGRTRDE